MTPNRFYLLAAGDRAGETAEGPYTKTEATLRAIADPSLKITTEAQLEARRARADRPFTLGQVIFTPGALSLQAQGVDLDALVGRHAKGDWGEVSQESWLQNEKGLVEHDALLSIYSTPWGPLWVKTEYDRTATTVFLPEED